MALTFGFYNSVNGDRVYDAIQFGMIFDGIITDGIYATYEKGMVVKASDNAGEVIIQPGRAWFNHTWSYNDADFIMEAPAPEVLLDRIDALVLDVNTENASRTNSFMWVQGTPSSNPQRPTLTRTPTHNQYPLCYVRRYPETTMIYARDITNMVGTSETPYVTGVLEGMDIDQWVTQWDDEFHNWENTTKDTYDTFFAAIQAQMQGDLTAIEEWVESIKDVIDSEAATHLQAEIDALAAMLPAGSHITIQTTNPNLYNMNVTVTDGTHPVTAKFNASGVAVIDSYPYVGVLQITSSDGLISTTRRVNVPYFGRYAFGFELWNATVNITGDENLYGNTVTIKNSSSVVIDRVTLDASTGTATWVATEADVYTFSTTYEGEDMSVELAVTEETLYEVNLETYKIYGFHIDGSESSPSGNISYAVQYNGKNVENYGYTPASMNFSTGVINPGSWNLTDDFFIPRSCMLKNDGTVDYYLSESDETKKADGVTASDVANTSYAGNAMMEWGRDGKQIWIKIVPDTDDDTSATIYVSDKQVDEDFHAYSFYDCDGNLIPHCYTAKYNGVNVSSKLRSISGQSILNNAAGATEITYATANNTKSGKTEWYIEQFCDRLMVNILLMMIGKSTNMQTKFGNGHYTGGSSASSLLRTGTMNGRGQFYGTNGTGAGVKVFGMENWWGNQWRRTAGLLNMSGTQKYKLTWSTVDGSSQVGYDATGAGYLVANSATPAGTSGGYINKMKFMSKAFVATQSSGSDSTYYCDGQWFNNGQANYALFGGHCYTGLPVGAFSCVLNVALSFAGWNVGAPLSCKPLAS